MGDKDKSEFASRVGCKLRELRGSRSFAEIADATGGAVSARLVQYYERGTEPRFGAMVVLLAALGTTPAEFVPELMAASSRRDAEAARRIVFGSNKSAPGKRHKIADDAGDASELASELGII